MPRPRSTRNTTRPSRTRRGSFLVTVVGVLAMLTVLTVIYVAIGRSDTRLTQAVAERETQTVDDVPQQMANYLAGIIGRDVFDTFDPSVFSDGSNANFIRPRLLAEHWDTPSTAFSVTFFDTQLGEFVTVPVTVGVTGAARSALYTPTGEVRIVDQNGEPVPDANGNPLVVGTGTDPWLASAEPTVFETDPGNLRMALPADYVLQRVDVIISNPAPDGAFINLANLRNNFDATPAEMREGLSTYEFVSGAIDLRSTPLFGRINTDSDLPTAQPHDWTAYQLGLASPPSVLLDIDREVASPDYLWNQYADANGDGFADSRWFEMREFRGSDENDFFRDLLNINTDDMRFVFAVHIEDLSARVNVNTATDDTLAPNRQNPMGETPASVDLRRLLGGRDFARDQDIGLTLGDIVDSRSDELYLNFDANITAQHGDRGYDALKLTLRTGYAPPISDPSSNPDGFGQLQADLAPFGGPAVRFDNALLSVLGESQYTRYIGSSAFLVGGGETSEGNPSDSVVPSGIAQVQSVSSTAFDDLDLLELVVFEGRNDETRFSRLEQALFDRGDRPVVGVGVDGAGPLRSDLPFTDEDDPEFRLLYSPEEDDQRALLELRLLDIRQRLTTISGSRPFRTRMLDAHSGQTAPDRVITEADLRQPFSIAALDNPAQDVFEILLETLVGSPSDLAGLNLGDPFNAEDAMKYFRDSFVGVVNFPREQTNTLSYGYRGPEVATRIAAFMAANFADAADTDNIPSRFTLILDNGSLPGGSINNAYQDIVSDDRATRPATHPYPELIPEYELLGEDIDGNILTVVTNPDDDILTPLTENVLPARAINIFGIEAQPILTEVQSYAVFTDATDGRGGGDVDSPQPGTPGFDPNFPQLPTINGSRDLKDNTDFLFEVLAFQVHNPFADPVDLFYDGVDSAEGAYLYYIRYGELILPLYDRADDMNTSATEPAIDNETPRLLTLAPATDGDDTIVFYLLSQDPAEIRQRMETAAVGGLGFITDEQIEQYIENFIEAQIGDGNETVRVWPIDVANDGTTTGDVEELTSKQWEQLHTDESAGATPDEPILAVELWRADRPQFEANTLDRFGYRDEDGDPLTTDIDIETVVEEDADINDLATDTLVDRLRQPTQTATASSMLDLGFVPSDEEIDGAVDGAEGSGDNTGLTKVRFARYGRNADPAGDDIDDGRLRGFVPAYMIEARFQSITPNDDFADGLEGKTPEKSDFDESDEGGFQSLAAFLSQYRTPDPSWEKQSERIREAPYAWDLTDPSAPGILGSNGQGIPWGESAPGGDEGSSLRPEFRIVNDDFVDGTGANQVNRLRPSHLASMLAVGPWHDPGDPTDPNDDDRAPLSEVLALALAYDAEDPTNWPQWQIDMVTDLDGLISRKSTLDHGTLWPDRFIPFLNDESFPSNNGELVFEASSTGDVRVGPAITPVMSLLDRLSGATNRGPNDELAFGNVNTPVYGTININTAPLETLRMLPMLSPAFPQAFPDSVSSWWAGNATAPFGDIANQHDANSDIAATLASYRDRTSLWPRSPFGAIPPSVPDTERIDLAFSGTPTTPIIPFTPLTQRTAPDGAPFGYAGPEAQPIFGFAVTERDTGRADRTGIAGLDERPGIKSLGELLAVRDLDVQNPDGLPSPHNIARLGFDGNDLVDPAIDITSRTGTAGNLIAEQQPDDIDEQYAIINGLLDTTSVGSDFYVAWFIVRGYTREDVSLDFNDDGDEDDNVDTVPMIPSVERRFVMVVDRSNVTNERFPQPVIRLLQEVPVVPHAEAWRVP